MNVICSFTTQQTEYWGTMDRYNRLLRVKQQWDPDNLFWCHHCVGSDLVTYNSPEPCPTPFDTYSSASGILVTNISGIMLMVLAQFVIFLK